MRFRAIFPYTLPGVLALIGWWWYITRKKARPGGHSKAKLTPAPESIAKADGREHYTAPKDLQDFDTIAGLTITSEEKIDESVDHSLKLVPALQVETSEHSEGAKSSSCLLTDKCDASAETNVQMLLLDSSPRSQEVLFMSNVQGPLQTSPKAEKESYPHQLMDKISSDPSENWQPPVCGVVKTPTPFPVPKSSVSPETEMGNSRALSNLSVAECEPPVNDHPNMERPEPEGENAGNLTEPPCFKTTLNNISLSPFLTSTGPCQDSNRESQPLKDSALIRNGLPADLIVKDAARDEIEVAAAGLISEVITAAKQELFASQLDPCVAGVCETGATGSKFANAPATADLLSRDPGADEVRRVNEEEHSVTGTSVVQRLERAVGELSKPDGEGEQGGFAIEHPTPIVSRKSSEEANLTAEDSGCHSEDGAIGEDLPEGSAASDDLKNHQDALSSRVVSKGHLELSCEEKLEEPEMALGESGTRGNVPKDCMNEGDQNHHTTEEVQPNLNKHLDKSNATAGDVGSSVCHFGAGAEEPMHTKVTPATEHQKTDALRDSVTGRTPPEQDPKHRHGPLGHQGTKVTYANGGRAEEGADGSSQLCLEMEFDHSGGSDVNSIDSNDSGCTAGGPEALNKDGATLNALQDKTELTIWEVQVPKHLVGRLIGKQGRYVSFLKQSSGAKIYISTLPYTQDFQICHIEGNQQQVDKALNLIGKKFKELDLRNLYVPPPPLTLPSLPITSWLMLPDGVTVEVLVVNIVNAGHMFVQQHTHPTCHVLRSMDQQMFMLYSQPGIPTLSPPLEVGIICAAPAVNGAWWRAQVVAYFEETNEVEIRYVDYGGYERVKIEALRQIRSDFVSLPFQGTEVLLDNIMPPPDEDHFSEEANAAMDEMTRGAALLAQVTGYDSSGVPLINLWSIIGDEVLFLNRILVEKGHAQWIESY